ncbi:hypothetical protein F9817_14475 [Vibrio sp. CAIM 722]|uniref:Uncharacterized protein n=3 Tax=Vibrionaceae TaxID=641 RepID=A0A7X4LMB9_9VIBR|nr:hypothetical protein [Vibrio nitrifigilis]MZI94400.1 hypothetical protein [Vibrio eleionomae]
MDLRSEEEKVLGFKENIILTIIFCGIALMSNWAGTGHSFFDALPGMLILFVMIVIGMGLKAVIPGPIPTVAWVSLVSVVCTLPGFPGSETMLAQLKALSFLSLATPVLAYAAMAVTHMEVTLFKQSGIKIAIVSLLVFTGTYVGSAFVAQSFL